MPVSFPLFIMCLLTIHASPQEEGIRQEWYKMRAEERLKAEGRLVDGEAAPGDILAQVCMCRGGGGDAGTHTCVCAESTNV